MRTAVSHATVHLAVLGAAALLAACPTSEEEESCVESVGSFEECDVDNWTTDEDWESNPAYSFSAEECSYYILQCPPLFNSYCMEVQGYGSICTAECDPADPEDPVCAGGTCPPEGVCVPPE